MKKILVVCAFFLISFHAFPQDQSSIIKPIKKGNIILGGDFKLSTDNYYEKHTYTTYPLNSSSITRKITISTNPVLGYFVTNGLAVGISPTFQYSFSRFESILDVTNTGKYHSFSIGSNLFVKYYLENGLFFEFETGYRQIISANSTEKVSGHNYLFIPSIGYAIFINQKVAIEPKINYEFNRFSQDSYSRSLNEISFSVTFSIFL